MTIKFKVGDRVVRTEPYTWVFDYDFMQKDSEYIVSDIIGILNLKVEGSNHIYASANFKLVEENPVFKAMKFRVNTPEQSKEIQEALFSMGYGWEQYAKKVMFQEDVWDWIYTEGNGYIWRMYKEGEGICSIFDSAEEFTIKTTKSYELIPVETEIPEETIELMGQKYSKKELENALRSLKPVE